MDSWGKVLMRIRGFIQLLQRAIENGEEVTIKYTDYDKQIIRGPFR